jgi:hypothetical protein
MAAYMTEAEFEELPRDVRKMKADGSRVCLRMSGTGPEVEEVVIVTVRVTTGARLIGQPGAVRIVEVAPASFKVQYRLTRHTGIWVAFMPNKTYSRAAAQQLLTRLVNMAALPLEDAADLS